MTNIKSIILKIVVALIIIQFIFAINNVTMAAGWDDILNSAGDFLETGKKPSSSGLNESNIKSTVNDIYSILFTLGVAITVIVGGVLGIKFMMASAEDKAKLKESLVPYVAGCIVIYGAFGIWKLSITIFSALS